jgi:prepilin-type N-terminal cleavage/methylation domain-containing protein
VDSRKTGSELAITMLKRRAHHQRGFTFLEIIIALMILASGAGILIGLESATIQRTIEDRTVQQAMLAARRIMAAIETIAPPDQVTSLPRQPLITLLQELKAPPGASPEEKMALERYTAEVQVEVFPLPLPNIEPNPLQMVSLKIFWSERPADLFEIQYLIPINDGET